MNKIIFTSLFIFLTSFSWQDKNYSLLSEDDFIFAEEDNATPAISIPASKNQWLHSFNQWQCFPAHKAKVEVVNVDYNGWHEVPSIKVIIDDTSILSFDLDPDEDWEVEDISADWQNTLNNSARFCIFAAFMQSHGNEHMYYIEQIKFENSYWSRSEEIEKMFIDTDLED